MGLFDLPIERQREIAKLMGYSVFEDWVKHEHEMEAEFAKARKEREEKLKRGITREEADRKIHDLRNNPYAIHFYRRITDDYDLTVEEVISNIERSVKS